MLTVSLFISNRVGTACAVSYAMVTRLQRRWRYLNVYLWLC